MIRYAEFCTTIEILRRINKTKDYGKCSDLFE